jgi:hypothetical protein
MLALLPILPILDNHLPALFALPLLGLQLSISLLLLLLTYNLAHLLN